MHRLYCNSYKQLAQTIQNIKYIDKDRKTDINTCVKQIGEYIMTLFAKANRAVIKVLKDLTDDRYYRIILQSACCSVHLRVRPDILVQKNTVLSGNGGQLEFPHCAFNWSRRLFKSTTDYKASESIDASTAIDLSAHPSENLPECES